jgi:four helix bundle protein
MTHDFRELRVWQAAMDLAESIYSMTRNFPSDERYGLTSQLRRAAVSVASCVAEGNARDSTKDYAPAQTSQTVIEGLRSTAKQLQALKNAIAARIGVDSPFPVSRSPFPA